MDRVAGVRETVFRQRGRLTAVLFAAALVMLLRTGKTLGLREPTEDLGDVLGCLLAVLGHVVRIAALRHIGPSSRTRKLGAPRLVTTGPYAIIRNPLYLGNWLIVLGLCLVIQLGWLLAIGPPFMLVVYYIAVLAEEPRLLAQFGEEYRQYCLATPRLAAPGLFTRRGLQRFFGTRGAHTGLYSKEYWSLLATFACMALIELHEHLWAAR